MSSSPLGTEKPFFWGAATAAHQVEGYNHYNDWWAWEQANRPKESSGAACDHYRRYLSDIHLIAELGHNAHRFSLEWSRLEPLEGKWNPEAFEHYEKVLRELRKSHIEPIVTLHHFTNPLWFSQQGGWASEKSVFYFTRFVKKAAEAFGPSVRFWITVNEPMVYLFHGYCTGLWPPGHRSFAEALTVFRHLMKAHAAAYHEIHEYYERCLGSPVWVSIAKHLSAFEPCNPANFKDRWYSSLRDRFFNHLALQALKSGFLFFPGVFCEFLSCRPTLDFIGVNYYTRHFVKGTASEGPTPLGADCEEKHHKNQAQEYNVMGWEVYPEGFYRMLTSLRKYRLPVLICENGICAFEDKQRERFIESHLEALERAEKKGLKVWGYLYWSLMDNFEWAEGFGPRFGIIEVDYSTQERKIRPSAYVLSRLCRKKIESRLLFGS